MSRAMTKAIKEDYGTVKRFCKIHGINYRTYNVVCSGYSSSKKVTDALIKGGYIKSADELKRKSA